MAVNMVSQSTRRRRQTHPGIVVTLAGGGYHAAEIEAAIEVEAAVIKAVEAEREADWSGSGGAVGGGGKDGG